MSRKPGFQALPDTVHCIEYLRTRERATYQEIGQHLGRNIKGRDRYVLESARRILEREGIVFVVETGIGVVRANDPEIAVLSTEVPVNKVKNTLKRAKKREHIVDIQRLTTEERAAFHIGRAVLGAIKQAVRLALRNKIAKEVKQNDGPLPIEKTIELFSRTRLPN